MVLSSGILGGSCSGETHAAWSCYLQCTWSLWTIQMKGWRHFTASHYFGKDLGCLGHVGIICTPCLIELFMMMRSPLMGKPSQTNQDFMAWDKGQPIVNWSQYLWFIITGRTKDEMYYLEKNRNLKKVIFTNHLPPISTPWGFPTFFLGLPFLEDTSLKFLGLEDVEAEVAPDSRPIEEIIEERRAALPPGAMLVGLMKCMPSCL